MLWANTPADLTVLVLSVPALAQLSVAVGVNACAAASPAASVQANVRFSDAGVVVQVGAWVSPPVYTTLAAVVLPQPSVTVNG